ncbi:dipeptide ABC transporter ATP-binding protein [Verrucomicrobiota bacterium]
MSNDYTLRVDNLRTYFRTAEGTAKAVDGVSFGVRPGETYALVGESGCGKSVTALSILQLVPKPAGYIAGGTVHLGDEQISSLPPVAMRRIRGNGISMIFQEPMTALNPVFTVGNQISEGIILHQRLSKADARKKSIDMLDKVGIPDPEQRYNEYPHQMSGGMRQRVMIAMALACQPEVLIADEPTTALDVTIQSQILSLVTKLQQELGTAVLLITHNMGVVKENADRVGVMYAGRTVEEASRDRIFAVPSHPYTRLLLRAIPSRGKRGQELVTIKGMVPKATEFPAGCRFSTRCPFVMDRCRTEEPRPCTIADGHSVECFLFDNGSPVRDVAPDAVDEAPAPLPQAEPDRVRLEVNDLKMYFPIKKGVLRRIVGHVKAVDGVSLKVHKGETLALVGESGCGKTTVGKCLVRLLDPTGGSVRFRGRDLARLSRALVKDFRREIQMIFQDPFSSLNPRLMIGETVTEGMETHGIGTSRAEREQKLEALLPKVGLAPDMAGRYPHEFSGGQRQRIGLARALAVDPELVICDEATSSLDVSVQAQILNLLKGLQRELGLSYLFITHDLSVVRYLADRVSVMYLGRIVEEGTTEEIFGDTRHPYTRALLSAVPQVDETEGRKRIVLEGDVPSPVNPPSGCHFHPRCPDAKPECAKAYPESVSFTETHRCHCILYTNR